MRSLRRIQRPTKIAPLTILALFSLWLGGCSNHKVKASHFRFNTLITEQGIKLFELSSQYRREPFVIKPVANPYGEKKENDAINKRLLAELEYHMEATKFCRKGYLLLGRHAGETTHKIRGECRERASEDDIGTFPNTIKQW